ncbi:MAG TPA: copper resistance CopC family protein [Naasia sp.]|jgi:methionine-rich copper-binding protein CopC
MHIRRIGGVLAAAAAALGLALAAPLAASAHDSLSSSTPADGETVTSAPDAIELTFTGVLLDLGEGQRSTAIQVRQDGRYYETACPALADRTASAPIALGGAGDYEVLWQVVSSDGHPTSGTYTFTYEPESGAEEAPGAEQPACAGEAAAGGTGGSTGGDDQLIVGLAAGIGGLALIGVILAVVLGRRRAATGGDFGGSVDDGTPSAPGADAGVPSR